MKRSGKETVLLSLSEKIKYARLTARLKSREVAERAGIAITTYCRYERGEIMDEHIDCGILVRIAEACGFPRDFCLDNYQRFRCGSAEVVRKYMTDKGFTNEGLAAQLGVSTTTIKQWKRGKCSPSHKQWEAAFRDYYATLHPET